MKRLMGIVSAVFLLAATGCAPAVIGAGAAGAYSVGTDERTVGQMWSDTTITTRVKTALIKDPGVSSLHIDVDTIDRNVTLTGQVGTQQEAQWAGDIAAKVSGVKSVKNLLQVGSKSIGESMDDSVLGTRIKTRLTGTPGIRSMNIDVDVNKGVVTLTGIVESEDQRNQVVEIAQKATGTVRVIDNLTVK